ncbi:MAG: hypothetical protein ACRDZN_17940 [Acidimicrobiales bacterium]
MGEDRIDALLREAIGTVAPNSPALRVEPRVSASADLPDSQDLVLGMLDLSLRFGADTSDETMGVAREILEHRGSTWRSNKNAAMLVAADGPAVARARSSARTLAALRDLQADRHRLNRFNSEQREQLSKRLAAADERLPQQVAMAYRHLLLLGEADEGGTKLDHIDLGPARVDAKVGERVLDYLRSADRLVETTLAPTAFLAARFGLLPEGTDVVELDALLGYFYRLPRLPKLAGASVLRESLVDGVAKGIFGLASGSSWDADDAVLRFAQTIEPSQVQFQPGTWLVRAAGAEHPNVDADTTGGGTETASKPHPEPTTEGGSTAATTPSSTLSRVTIRVRGVPAGKARDVVDPHRAGSGRAGSTRRCCCRRRPSRARPLPTGCAPEPFRSLNDKSFCLSCRRRCSGNGARAALPRHTRHSRGQ